MNRTGLFKKKAWEWGCVASRRYEMTLSLASKETTDLKLKSFDDIPTIRRASWAYLPIIGKYDTQKMGEVYRSKYMKYGKIVREDLSKKTKLVHLFDVEDIEKVFRHEGKFPYREPPHALKVYRDSRKEFYQSGGLIMSFGQEWYDLRSKMQPHMLKPKSIHAYQHQMNAVAVELVDKIRLIKDGNNELDDLMPYLHQWSLESVALMALETKLNCLNQDLCPNSEASRFIHAAKTAFVDLSKLEFSRLKLWRFFPSPTYRRFAQNWDICNTISLKHIREARARIEADSNRNREATLLELLFYKENINEKEATTMIMDFLMAGIDTTANSVAFALYYLAKNTAAQEKAFQEVHRVMPNVKDQLKPEHLNEISYLKACTKESSRLDPVVQYIPRTLPEDIVLSGYEVPAGVCLMIHVRVPSRLEENFKDAHLFQPERWLRGENVQKINPFAFLPFGQGVRQCVGRRFAEYQMWTVLAWVLRHYKVEYRYEDIGAVTGITSRPDKPLRFRFIERRP